jgi:large subunit ribosomal protein L10
MKREIKQWKKDKVKDLTKKIDSSPIVGIVDMRSLPAKQLQHMREEFRGRLEIIMAKKALITRALEKSKFKPLAELITGMPALLLTDIDPFRLAVLLNKNRVPAPAKPGDIAPHELTIKAGLTPFTPGPVIAELSELGIRTKVEAGKLAVMKDAVVAKTGDEISEALAGILKRLDIHPMEIGLHLIAVSDNKKIFKESDLEISESEYVDNISLAHQQAFNLACATNFLVSENVVIIMSQAHSSAYNLAVSASVINEDTLGILFSLANSQCMAVAHEVNAKDPKGLSESLSKFITEIDIKEVFGGK